MKTDFGEVGVEEDVLGVDQVEVYFLEGGGNGGATGLVKIDLETISKLVFQLVRKQATELPSRTFGGLKGPNVIFSLTTMGSDVEVNNSRSDGFCLKMRRQEENRQNEEIDRTTPSHSGEEERGQWARAIDDGPEREHRISVTVSGLTILLRVLENLISEKSLGICLKEENFQCLFWQI